MENLPKPWKFFIASFSNYVTTIFSDLAGEKVSKEIIKGGEVQFLCGNACSLYYYGAICL